MGKKNDCGQSKAKVYPSSGVCLDEVIRAYDRLISNYEKIYDRANIVISICSLVLLVGAEMINKTLLTWEYNIKSYISLTISVVGEALIVWSAYISIQNLKTTDIHTVDTKVIREENLVSKSEEVVEVYLTNIYLNIIPGLSSLILGKQKSLNKAIKKLSIGLALLLISIIFKN